MQRALYLYAGHVTRNIQTVASRFVKRRDHPQEYPLIFSSRHVFFHQLRFCRLKRDDILCNRGTRRLVVVRICTTHSKHRYCEGCNQCRDEVLKQYVQSAYSLGT